MNRSNHNTLALLSAITIGLVNIASLSVVYIVFHNASKPATSAVAQSTAGTPNDSTVGTTTGSTDTTGQTDTQTSGTTGTPSGNTSSTPTTAGKPSTTGSSGSSGGTTSTPSGSGSTKTTGGSAGGSTGTTSGSGSTSTGGTTTPPPAGPNSLAKGSPCQTQTPPAGVCTAVLSFNNQKDGNPYWDPTLLADIKQGIASDSFVKLLGLNPTTIYNGMTVTLKESTWSGSATHSTIQGTMSAEGQSQATTFTLDWNGSKWIVDDAAEN